MMQHIGEPVPIRQFVTEDDRKLCMSLLRDHWDERQPEEEKIALMAIQVAIYRMNTLREAEVKIRDTLHSMQEPLGGWPKI